MNPPEIQPENLTFNPDEPMSTTPQTSSGTPQISTSVTEQQLGQIQNPHAYWQNVPAQFNLGQPFSAYPYQWMPYPWIPGMNPVTSSPGSMPSDGGPPANIGADATIGPEQTGASSFSGTGSQGQSGAGLQGQSQGIPPGFVNFPFAAAMGRPEPGDALYVSSSDGPELRLISHPLTGPENYSTWAREFRRALITKDKEGFVDGTVPIPTNEKMGKQWRKCNQLVRTWIGNCINPEIAAGLPPTEDSKIIWDSIREMYGKLDRAKIFSLHQALSELKQGNTSVTTCFNRLSALWNELEAAEEKLEGSESTLQQYKAIKDREKATRFLLILNDSHLTFRSQILAMEPPPTLGRIFQLAVQEENQRLASSDSKISETLALAARVEKEKEKTLDRKGGENREQLGFAENRGLLGFADQKPYKWGSSDGSDRMSRSDGSRGTRASDHLDGGDTSALRGSNGPQNSKGYGPNFRNKGKLFCDFCKRPHHTIDTCWKLHGRPGEKEKRGKEISAAAYQISGSMNSTNQPITHREYQQLMQALQKLDVQKKGSSFTGISYCLASTISRNTWIIDSGASDHIACDRRLFSAVNEDLKNPVTVQLPNGSVAYVTTTGTVELNPHIVLTNVLYIPDFQFNLVSVSRACKDNSCRVLFNTDTCLFQALSTGTLMGWGSLSEGLFFWKSLPANFNFPCNKKSLCNSISNDRNFLLHSRLGHSSQFPYPHCQICPLAKQSRNSFPLSQSRSRNILSLLHIDVWGPYHTVNHDGSRFFLTIVDDHSRATWIFLMQSKSQVVSHLKTFLSLSKTQFGKPVQKIRTDNGKEFFNHECANLLSSQGILHESSCTYTPQQNGVVERKHRHLLEVARALKFQGSIPDTFWGDCILTAAYLINRMPTKVLDGQSPFQVLFGKKPDLSHLRVFWLSLLRCYCWAQR